MDRQILTTQTTLLALGVCALSVGSTVALDLENHPGKAIYQQHCVSCHGPGGGGADDYPEIDPLFGSRSIESLAGRIDRTMPEFEEELVVGKDAEAVAEYIYHAFYSEEARAKTDAPRVDLTRLTGEQLQNSVTDVLASFHNEDNPAAPAERGLRGVYVINNRKRAGQGDVQRERFERVESVVRFDFGKAIPKAPPQLKLAEDMNKFEATWLGSIHIPETGVYEFTIRTRNGSRLWLNELDRKQTPLIDGWVSPNNEWREITGKIHLLGGRRYPIYLEIFKHDDPLAGVELYWKPPHHRKELVPARVLSPVQAPERFVSARELPADDRSQGYERGATVSRVWLESVHSVAYAAADWTIEELDKLSRSAPGREDRGKKIRAFSLQLVERAFRRPLSDVERRRHIDAHFAGGRSEEDAIRRVVLHAFTSPQFLYPQLAHPDPSDPYAKAASLALVLWDSVPDRNLFEAARKNQLDRYDRLRRQTERMLQDGRARHKVSGFFHHWLELSRTYEVAKDEALFPEFDEALMSDLRASLKLFIEDTVWSDRSDYRKLLLSDEVYINRRLGEVYGVPDAPWHFTKKKLPGTQRAGVITHPYLLTAFAYHNNTSPIHRGVFLTRNIAGMPLKAPPEAIEFAEHDFPADLTMREKVTELTKAKSCMACHSLINPLGFSLEHFDAMGRFRETDGKNPINDDSLLVTDAGKRVDIEGPRDVAEFAAYSPTAHRAFIRQLFEHAAKQPMNAFGMNTDNRLLKHFQENQFHIRDLLAEIAILSTEPVIPES